tara:strand:+ start:543 stop:713 length:171 start_codon:yes stop_codon:yes gene_type:complete
VKPLCENTLKKKRALNGTLFKNEISASTNKRKMGKKKQSQKDPILEKGGGKSVRTV